MITFLLSAATKAFKNVMFVAYLALLSSDSLHYTQVISLLTEGQFVDGQQETMQFTGALYYYYLLFQYLGGKYSKSWCAAVVKL